jgi:hypothetical protein
MLGIIYGVVAIASIIYGVVAIASIIYGVVAIVNTSGKVQKEYLGKIGAKGHFVHLVLPYKRCKKTNVTVQKDTIENTVQATARTLILCLVRPNIGYQKIHSYKKSRCSHFTMVITQNSET